MPEEIFVIIIVAIAAGTFSGIVKQVLNYLQSRNTPVATSDGGVRTSELRDLMIDAVEEATEPLYERIASLEARLEATPQLQAPPLGELLDELEEPEKDSVRPRRSRIS